MIILAPELPFYILLISKIAAAVIIMLIAFKFYRVKSFFLSLFIFLFSNFLFLGIIIGIYTILKSDFIAINNSVVYLDISARGLLICAFVSYLISCLVVRLYNKNLSKNEVYTITIENNSQSVNLFAFADTGNKLREPFSNAGVIIADKSKVESLVDENKVRLIPASTVNDKSLLVSFKPERVIIKSSSTQEVVDNVYIALSDEIKNENFSAILNPEILSI